MKQKLLQKTLLLLFALIAGSSSVWAQSYKWVKTAPADLNTDDIVVIVDQTTSKAMTNGNGTSAPSAVNVTLKADGSEITSEVAATIQWTLTTSGSGASKTFQFAKDDDNYLYVTNTNKGVKVGAGDRNTFTVVTGGDNSGYYLYNSITDPESDTRYVGCYSGSDWRCYTTINTNIKGNNNAFFKRVAASGPVDPFVTITTSTIAVGETATISGPAGLSISFSGYDDDVVTVSSEGVVTGVAAGSTTITATWSAVTGTYNAGSKDFEVTVIAPDVYEKVTSVTQLVPGNEYILVATGNNKAMGGIDSNGSNIRNSVDVTISGGNSINITDEEVVVLTLGGTVGEWTFLASDNNEYLAYSGSSNQLHSNADETADASKWVITEDFQLESANVPGRVLKYNSGSPRFACYASGQQDAVLFVKAGSPEAAPVTITDKKYATFCFTSDLDFNGTGITVYQAKVESNKVKFTEVSDGLVKAGEGVLLYMDVDEETTVFVPVTTGVDWLDDNELVGVTAEEAIEYNPTSDVYNYILQMDGANLVFRKATGAKLRANRAYLSTSYDVTAPGARELEVSFGDETAINALENSNKVNDGAIYDLSGRRVENPTKGIYIMNGKKVIFK